MAHMQANRPFLGICLGLQMLFEGSDENGGVEGLGLISGRVARFDDAPSLPVPHIGWNTLEQRWPSACARHKPLSSVQHLCTGMGNCLSPCHP